MTERQFTPPWSVQELEACFIVKDGAGQKLTFESGGLNVCFGPCVDGSELARTFFTNAALVGAAMCSASHDGISVN